MGRVGPQVKILLIKEEVVNRANLLKVYKNEEI